MFPTFSLLYESHLLSLFSLTNSQERKLEIAAAVEEKLLEAICGIFEDENKKKSMLSLLRMGK